MAFVYADGTCSLKIGKLQKFVEVIAKITARQKEMSDGYTTDHDGLKAHISHRSQASLHIVLKNYFCIIKITKIAL